MDHNEDLEVLDGGPRVEVDIGGGMKQVVEPLRGRDLPGFARAVRPIAGQLAAWVERPPEPDISPEDAALIAAVARGEAEAAEVPQPPVREIGIRFSLDRLLELADEQGEALLSMIAIGAGLPRESVDDLRADVLLQLATAVLEVNVDFFAQRVIPAALSAMTRITISLAGTGLISVSASRVTDTPAG